MNILKLKQNSKVFSRIFGLQPDKFDELVLKIKPLWQKAEAKRLNKRPRKIRKGSGRPYLLSLEESVAMLLLYTRSYTTHLFLSALFDIHESAICRYFAKLRPVVESVFDLPTDKTDLREAEILKLIVDATEQRTERRDKGSGYSGKKKTETIKTQIVVDKQGKIIHVSDSIPGNIHDKKLFDNSGVSLPDNAKGDLGYLGTGLIIPHKSSKLHSLTKKQTFFNLRHSRQRIIVEHVFALLKSYRLLADRFRGHLKNYNQYFLIVCGLYNFARA